MRFDVPNTVFVFDLDDTLYAEGHYQVSGMRQVALSIQEIYGANVNEELEELLDENNPDILGAACKSAGLPESIKQSLLWIYRLHRPQISLDPEVHQSLAKLKGGSAGVAILTDGRSITQRLKLQALGLSDYPAYISEEYGDEKPSLDRFKAVMNDMPAKHFVYIADNPKKDFIGPHQLGWISIGLLATSEHIHTYTIDELTEEQLPNMWLSSLNELFATLIK